MKYWNNDTSNLNENSDKGLKSMSSLGNRESANIRGLVTTKVHDKRHLNENEELFS